VCLQQSYEGHAPLLLEGLLFEEEATVEGYRVVVEECHGELSEYFQVDPKEMIGGLLADIRESVLPKTLSLKFHNYLVSVICKVVERLQAERVILSGGCFQNRYLLEKAVCSLRNSGVEVAIHYRVPPGDGGLAIGQLVADRYSFIDRCAI
jgi:hydrogenase maturation protein HypF